MEMTSENLAKYNKQYPAPAPKHGRYAPDGQFFQCETQEQIDTLEAAGWKDNPFKLPQPYRPEECQWVQHWGQVRVKCEAPKVQPDEREALRAQIDALRGELEDARKSKGGRPKKIEA